MTSSTMLLCTPAISILRANTAPLVREPPTPHLRAALNKTKNTALEKFQLPNQLHITTKSKPNTTAALPIDSANTHQDHQRNTERCFHPRIASPGKDTQPASKATQPKLTTDNNNVNKFKNSILPCTALIGTRQRNILPKREPKTKTHKYDKYNPTHDIYQQAIKLSPNPQDYRYNPKRPVK